MFGPPDYVPLSILWEEFFAKKGAEVCRLAHDKYLATDFSESNEFGSPADLAEEIFLNTFGELTVALCSPTGGVMRVQPTIAVGFSSLFQRTSVFESAVISEDPEEAGRDGEWLYRMGSRRFVVSEISAYGSK